MDVSDFKKKVLALTTKAYKEMPSADVLYVLLLTATSLLYAQRQNRRPL